MAKATRAPTTKPQPMGLTERLVHLPRLTRIVIVMLFAALTTLLLTPLVDGIYMQNFFDYNTRIAPSLVSTGLGIIVFVIGWIVYVGYAGEEAPVRKAVLWYFLVGTAVLLLVLLLLITGALDTTQ